MINGLLGVLTIFKECMAEHLIELKDTEEYLKYTSKSSD